jgi:hypothetical protein
MKKFASLFLATGLLIMALALTIAVSAMNGNANIRTQAAESESTNTCLFCHRESHRDWNLISALQQPIMAQSIPTPACSGCHTMNAEALPLAEIQTAIDNNQGRVAALRQELAQIYLHYAADWNSDAHRSEKSAEQITAERISTLVAVVEADGSWGFHNPIYTEEILTEAERLMAEMIQHAGA